MTDAAGSDRVVQIDGRSKAYRPLPFERRADAVRAGLACYEAGEYFDAHEAWEPAWMGTADVAERALLQGLIKLAAADVHGGRGNPAGIVRNLEGAVERLRAAAEAGVTGAAGITLDVAALLADAERRLALATAGRPTAAVTIRWRPA